MATQPVSEIITEVFNMLWFIAVWALGILVFAAITIGIVAYFETAKEKSRKLNHERFNRMKEQIDDEDQIFMNP